MDGIYLDNGATTPLDPKVEEKMKEFWLDNFGNPSSVHTLGRRARDVVEESRKTIAKSVNAKTHEIYFTSGGTESNNWVIKGIAFALRKKGKHIITTKIEHKCILESCRWLEGLGYEITYLDVDEGGFVDEEKLKEAIRRDTVLVSIIHGNNEIGTIQDIKRLGKLCRDLGVYFHTDACQSYTKVPIDVKDMCVDLMTLNAHKIHGPKGVGALYIHDGVEIHPLLHGGGQEKGKRSGTSNVPGIVGFAEAVRLGLDKRHVEYMKKLRDKLGRRLLDLEETELNGPSLENVDERLCNNLNIMFRGVDNEVLGSVLDARGVYVSAGSACSARSTKPSHVLLAIGRTEDEARNSIRITLSRFNTEDEIDRAGEIIEEEVRKIRGGIINKITRLFKGS